MGEEDTESPGSSGGRTQDGSRKQHVAKETRRIT